MNTEKIIKELNFEASRSSGAGGQHVNKVSSKIELSFNLGTSDSSESVWTTDLSYDYVKINAEYRS